MVDIVVESSLSLRVAKEEILALSLLSLSSRAVALRSEVGVCFGGFVGGSAKKEILAWREAEVRGRTSSWFMWSLLSWAMALWSEVSVCFGGFVGGSVGANKVKKGQNDLKLKERGSHVGFGLRVGFVDVEMGSYLVVVVMGIAPVVVFVDVEMGLYLVVVVMGITPVVVLKLVVRGITPVVVLKLVVRRWRSCLGGGFILVVWREACL